MPGALGYAIYRNDRKPLGHDNLGVPVGETDAGGKIAIGPLEVPGGEWILNAFDRQGGYFCLLSNTK